MLSETQKQRIRNAFSQGKLRTRSVSPLGEVVWKRVEAVHRHEVPTETFVALGTEFGESVFTGGHRVFVEPTEKMDAERLRCGAHVLGILNECVRRPRLVSSRPAVSRRYMFDLSVADWHNFVLHRSKIVVSNSPDRNYHFRPATGEGVLKNQTRVFGQIWEDEELIEYLRCALDLINMYPPETCFMSIDSLVQFKRNWRSLLLEGAIWYALRAVTLNWIVDEFDYSIGGISLSINKAASYQGMADQANQNFKEFAEAAKRTVKIIMGLKQSRFGFGIRSAFGPAVRQGVMTPRNFVSAF